MSQIMSIVYKPADQPSQPAAHYTRVPITSAQLIAEYGIEGDRKGGHPKRQLNIMSQEALDTLAQAGFNTAPGAMGEQIIVSGLDVDALEVGAQVRLGAEVVIEITERRKGCSRFEALQGKPPTEAAGQMGIMARVITGGQISVGDSVQHV